jgi:hypothetical protein
MIIWGSKGKEKQVATGTFYCPTCRTDETYSHQRVSKYFTLYFIPVFPMENLGEYVRCLRCSGEFKTEVAGWGRDRVESLLSPWSCTVCSNTNPASQGTCLGCGAPRDAVPEPSESPA